MATNVVVPKAACLVILNELVIGKLNGSYLRLFKTAITIGADTDFSDFVEATFTGYSAFEINTWATVDIDGTGHAFTNPVDTPNFTPTSGGGSGNIYGWYLTDAANTEFYGCTLFAGAPITFANGVQLQTPFTYTDKYEFASS